MKKVFWMVTLVVLALVVLGVGVVLAQAPQPPVSGYGPNRAGDGEDGPLHDYMVSAMADAVGLSTSEFELRHDAGESFYAIALAQGYSADEIPSLMQAARTKVLEAAVRDGAITQEQADWMARRGFGVGGMMGGFGRGDRSGDCPMFEGDGSSFGPGRMGGGRWQQ